MPNFITVISAVGLLGTFAYKHWYFANKPDIRSKEDKLVDVTTLAATLGFIGLASFQQKK